MASADTIVHFRDSQSIEVLRPQFQLVNCDIQRGKKSLINQTITQLLTYDMTHRITAEEYP